MRGLAALTCLIFSWGGRCVFRASEAIAWRQWVLRVALRRQLRKNRVWGCQGARESWWGAVAE